MVTLTHNGCSLCFKTDGTCWRDEVVQRYRAAQSRWGADFPRTRSRFLRSLLTVMLAPIFGAFAGGTLSSGIWFLARTRLTGFALLAESTKLWRG